MKKIELTAPTLGFVIATRAALAFGVGLLVSPRLSDDRRRVLARSLIALGALTTIPAAMAVFGRRDDGWADAYRERHEPSETHAADGSGDGAALAANAD